MTEKPRHRSGYTPDETEIVRSACLTVAVTLGAHLDDVVIIGGLVPTLLIDSRRPTTDTGDEADLHPGTNDLDLGLSLLVLEDERYALISERLRAEGFTPDVNASGRPTVQRWTRTGLKVDFLIPQPPGDNKSGRIQNLESDFGAIVTPGLELAFEERVLVELEGKTLGGERVTRSVPVCGPGAFVVLKALAFGDRGEPKDAFDLVYVIRGSGGGQAVAEVIKHHADAHPQVVRQALRLLHRDFQSPDHVGPMRFAAFEHLAVEDQEAAAADAHGYIDDLLTNLRDVLIAGDDEPIVGSH